MINLSGGMRQALPLGGRRSFSRRGGVDVPNPIFGIGALMLVTVFPYFYQTFFIDVQKYWSLDQHLAFATAFAVVNLSLYGFYAGYLRALKSNLKPISYTQDFADLLLLASRCAVWIAMLTNFAVVAYVIPRYSGNIFSLKEAFGQLGGVNILTQLHLCFLGPYIGISVRRGSPWKLVVILLCISLIARSLLLSERMALMELAVPLVVILCLYRVVRVTWSHIALMLLAVPTFFIGAELMRSFYSKFVAAGGWGAIDPWFAIGWNLDRLFIYYIDVINKFYYVLDENLSGTSDFWFRGIGSIASNFGLTEDPTAREFTVLELILDGTGVRTPEMTNFGGFTQLFSDFGWWGFLAYIGLVILFFATHANAVRGSMLCVGLYPVLFLNFTDMARRIILFESRAIFPLVIFVVIYLGILIVSSAVPLKQDSSSRGRPHHRPVLKFGHSLFSRN
jgi:hypothetical protein